MSSIVAYESDNLTIVASEGKFIWGVDSQIIPTIRLHLSMLVNGRIKNIFFEMDIEKKYFTTPEVWESWVDEKIEILNNQSKQYWYTLVTWSSWNIIRDFIQQLWYWQDIEYRAIEHWIGKLYM